MTTNPIQLIIPKDDPGKVRLIWDEKLNTDFAQLIVVLRWAYIKLGRTPTAKELTELARSPQSPT